MDYNATHCYLPEAYLNVSQSKYTTARYILCGPVLTSVVLVGMLGNILSLLIFHRTKSRPRIYYYLMVLAAWDLALLVCSFLLFTVPVLLYGRQITDGPYVVTFPTFFMCSNMTHSGSIWIVVVLAVERYFALCHPLRYLTWDTEGRAKLLLVAVSLLAIIYHIPRYFEMRIMDCQYRTSSGSIEYTLAVTSSDLHNNALYTTLYKIVGGLLFFSFGPFLTLLILTTRVSLEVSKNMKLHRTLMSSRRAAPLRKPRSVSTVSAKSTSSASKRSVASSSVATDSKKSRQSKEDRHNLDLMLVAVMVKFCVCHTLPTVLDLSETMIDSNFITVQTFDFLVDVSNFLVVVNSSCNFAIYYLSSMKFRKGLKTLGRRSSRYALLKLRSVTDTYGYGASAKSNSPTLDSSVNDISSTIVM